MWFGRDKLEKQPTQPIAGGSVMIIARRQKINGL